MKIILSRKGFDSQYGGVASPIFPDGRLMPLPIPSPNDRATFDHLRLPGMDVAQVVSDLTRGRYGASSRVHCDPDLSRPSLGPERGWIPSFGQCGAALRHLQLCGVNRGDVFLFFGWFRRVDLSHGTWRYVRGAPNLHLIFGWLEVGEFVDLVSHRDQLVERAPWASRHPHVDDARYNQIRGGNGLYIAAAKSRLAPHAAFGAGQFAHYSQTLQLTDASSMTRSVWSLPGWFHPSGSRRAPQITFHEDVSRWKRKDGRAILQTVAKGQEFVFSTDAYPQALSWVRRLVAASVPDATAD